MTETLWILGASDPEMNEIEQLLVARGERVAHAVGADGNRVHAGNAYRAAGFRHVGRGGDYHCAACGYSHASADGATCSYCDSLSLHTSFDGDVILVECGGDSPAAVVVDHHRPGDTGYGRPPAEYLSASSLGQVVARVYSHAQKLERDGLCSLMSSEQHLIAAADHCLAAAYRCECPGVDPARLLEFRAAQRAKFQGRDISDVIADIESTTAILLSRFDRGDCCIVDMTDAHYPELPEAACRIGVAYVAAVTEPDGRIKHVVGGCTRPPLVHQWMHDRRAEGRQVYGDPVRGFAGAYV